MQKGERLLSPLSFLFEYGYSLAQAFGYGRD
jgi:hypothetical protein